MSELIHALKQMKADSGAHALAALGAAMRDLLNHSPAHAQRALAATALGQIGDERALAQLETALADPHVTVRYSAANALLELATPGAIRAVRQLLQDDDPGLRRMVLVALASEGVDDEAAVQDFVIFLEDQDPFVRQQAVLALQHTHHPAAFPHLLAHLHDPDSRVALAAARALGATQNPQAAAPLLKVASDETAYYQLRGAAIEALVTLDIPTLNTALIDILTDPDVDIRRQVLQALQVINTPAEAERVLQTADSHRTLVRPAIEALIRSGGTVVEQAMIDALGHLREWVRSLAVEVLGEIRSEEAVPALLRVLQQDEPEVRVLAANALGQVGNPAAVRQLAQALEDEHWLVGMAAASALRRINTPAAREALADWHARRGR